jgi:hypothetical protein
MAMKKTATRALGFVVGLFGSFLFVHFGFLPAFAQHAHGPVREVQTKVVIRLEKRSFQLGEGINVHVDLEAGAKGVYVARGWGRAGENIAGFRISLTTEDGRPAQTCGGEAIADNAGPPPATETFKKDFVFVAAGQSVGYREALQCVTPLPGKYKVLASYHPDHPQTKTVAQLPEANGLVLDHTVEAEPVPIEIK